MTVFFSIFVALFLFFFSYFPIVNNLFNLQTVFFGILIECLIWHFKFIIETLIVVSEKSTKK